MKNIPSLKSIGKVIAVVISLAFGFGIFLYFFWEFIHSINYWKVSRFLLLFVLVILSMWSGLQIAQKLAAKGLKKITLSADFKANLTKGLIIDKDMQTRLSQFEIDSIAGLAKKEIEREIKAQLRPVLVKMFIAAIAMFSCVLFIFFYPVLGVSLADRVLRLVII
ncbi:MAG: hypothetical protein PHP00_09475 [Thiotrichaceae bacterium]|nr:hypothetical protein [Thiotrichaceae bacterium]